ncbi:MAG TPA: methyltransferase domain-containing protein [Clostridia bacterium]|nr:methyltransferase domain-containing protein [Clostridia bacterium]
MHKVNYDKISEIYDTVRSGDLEVITYILDNKLLDRRSRVLEIGCGSGNNTVLMSAATEAEIYGLDQSRGMLDKAEKKSGRIHFMQGDAVTLAGIENESFDAVYMVDVIHHIRDIAAMFSNIYRVLKKYGMVFVFTDTHEKIRNERLTSKYFPETVEVELMRYQPTEQIFAVMKACGFSNVKLERLKCEEQLNMGEYLIKVAEAKGYSMFHLIPDEAIERGIQRIRQAMEDGPLSYTPNTPVFSGVKK